MINEKNLISEKPTIMAIPAGKTTETSFLISDRANRNKRFFQSAVKSILLFITTVSVFSVIFIFIFILKEAVPFFQLEGFKEFFTSTHWYPSRAEGAQFGALAIIYGSLLVTIGSGILSIVVGIPAAVCLSDMIPFTYRQIIKPIIEILAAIPSVVYGFFALVVFAPLLQSRGGHLLALALWQVSIPIALIISIMAFNLVPKSTDGSRKTLRFSLGLLTATSILALLIWGSKALAGLKIVSGTNALNGIVILSLMALPTIVSISEDSLNAVGRDLREASYALGATRTETIIKVIIPAASSGILTAIILGTMRAIGETMVVWMATGNATRITQPWFNVLQPIRTLTATIAGDMGEADHVTGSSRYHVLFAMALCLLLFTFIGNIITEYIMSRKKSKKSLK